MNKILIINGPNLNLLGEREQSQYGSTTFNDLKQMCQKTSEDIGIKLDLIERIIEHLRTVIDVSPYAFGCCCWWCIRRSK